MRITNFNAFPRFSGFLATCFVATALTGLLTSDANGQSSSRIKYALPVQDLDDMDDDDQKSSNDQLLQSLNDGTELNKPIMDIRLNVIDYAASKPNDESTKLFEMSYANNYPNTFQSRLASWCAPNIRYQPLYFEDVGVERYGYNYGDDRVEPLASGFFFAKSFTLLTLNMMRQRPNSCTSPLGFCRPGGPAPQIEPKWLRRHR